MSSSAPRFETDDDVAEAVLRYLDDALSPSALSELARRIEADPHRRALFADVLLQAQVLTDYGGRQHAVPGRSKTDHFGRSHRSRRRVWQVMSAATAVAVACMLVWLAVRSSAGPTAATLVQLTGEAVIVRPSGESQVAVAGESLGPGDRIELRGTDASAVVELGAVRVDLAGQALLTSVAPDQIRLERGKASVQIDGRLSEALRVATPHSESTAASGAFRIVVTEPWTELWVESGRLELTSRTTSERLVVEEDQRVLVIPQRELIARTTPQLLPTHWSEDFESGIPPGWLGRFVAHDLPQGSQGAIGVQIERRDDGAYYSIGSSAAWDAGIVRLTATSHLNITYRLEQRPQWCNLFLSTRSSGMGPPEYFLNRIKNSELWEVAGEWRTVRIPITSFEKKTDGEFSDEPPAPGELATGFLVSSIDTGLDLTIDRIWWTEDGPGRVTFLPVGSFNEDARQ